MAEAKRGLGRGLSALIPDEEMELFRRVAREESATVSLESRTNNARLGVKKASKVSFSQNDESELTPIKSEKSLSPQSLPEFLAGKMKKEAHKNTLVQRSSDITSEAKDSGNPKQSFGASLNESAVNVDKSDEPAITTRMILLSDIEANPYQPRRTFDQAELSDLALSLREHGVIQPVVVRPLKKGKTSFQLVAGERRWRAAQLAGLLSVPALVRAIDDQQSLELALIENVQRHDISAIDAALAYKRLADEFHLSQEAISNRVGKSRSAVANTIRLLDLLPEIRRAIETGALTEGHGRAILLAQGEGARRALFRRATRDKLSVRDTERLAHIVKEDIAPDLIESGSVVSGKIGKNFYENNEKFLEETASRLRKKLGVRLQLKSNARGGKIVIEYSTLEELQRLLDLIV